MATVELTQISENVQTARAVVEEHGTPERIERLENRYPRTATPQAGTLRHDAYTSELLAGLAEVVADLKATP